ncbi:type III secretion system export apparatus subunit SctU [Chitinivorax sp. PXF-14]|uniref:type III secretion system export apparatus subunit SctU n=1 Tax=Chitinivorax sp. PXF-14 TaxID=3230488 RepID=UPI0034674BA4
MSQEDAGDKTELPTQKKIKDARKDGNVAKSKELTSTLVVLAWLLSFATLSNYAARRFATLFDTAAAAVAHPGLAGMAQVGEASLWTLLSVSLPLLLIAMVFGVLGDFFQVGALLAFKKIKPDASHINPASGFKRMFSMDNLFEVAKAILKTAVLLAIGWTVIKQNLPQIMALPQGSAGDVATAMGRLIFKLGSWTVFVFLLVSLGDIGYQRFSWLKKLKMSRRDIKQEMKEQEGDPMIKQQRRQLHQEWANQNSLAAVRKARALVVNPTHIAIALYYEPGETLVPIVTAKGEDDMALRMREEAEKAGVPILRNVPLARDLNERVALDDYVPADTFEAIAEILRWADQVRRGELRAGHDGTVEMPLPGHPQTEGKS